MVGFLQCPGPNSLVSDPSCNMPSCAGFNFNPCPFCCNICPNPSIQTEKQSGNCTNEACKCCSKAPNAEPIKNPNSCQCCGTKSSEHQVDEPKKDHYCCPNCVKVTNNQNATENQPFNYEMRQQPAMNYSFCPYYYDSYGRCFCNNQYSTPHHMNMAQCCQNYWGFPCNMNTPSPGCSCHIPSNPVKQNVSDKMVDCKLAKSVMVVGGRLVNCYCRKRNGLQDECDI